jgi:hypothetical protein
MQGEATKSARRMMRTEVAGRPNFLYFNEWLFTWGGATDGRSEWYGPVSGESMARLHENQIFKKEAKWRPWVRGLSEVMDRAVGRSGPKGNDEKLHRWLHANYWYELGVGEEKSGEEGERGKKGGKVGGNGGEPDERPDCDRLRGSPREATKKGGRTNALRLLVWTLVVTMAQGSGLEGGGGGGW